MFRVDITEPGTLTVYSTGMLDTVGRLKRDDGTTIGFDDDGGFETNFRIEAEVAPGTYYVKVTGYNHTQTGSYRLHVEFLAAAGGKKVLVPLFLSASASQQKGVRDLSGSSTFRARGRGAHFSHRRQWRARRHGLSVHRAGSDRPFNSQDLEEGNPEKGLSSGIGPGTGDWRLEFESDLEIEVTAYVRTEDRFLTSMHDLVVFEERQGVHHVPVFNPASNSEQRSRLRLINPDPDNTVEVKITGMMTMAKKASLQSNSGCSPGLPAH